MDRPPLPLPLNTPLDPPTGPRAGLIAFILLAPLAVFAAMVAVDRALGAPGFTRQYAVEIPLPPPQTSLPLPKIEGAADQARPLVVIDAGHGGHDPGAQGDAHVEKDLTLALARALRDRLLADGNLRVALTRDTDRYLLLEERSTIARRMKADLFLSIHADAADGQSARGATLYTLSERGSTEEAERLATAQNRADTVNGVSLATTSPQISAILVDLAQRRTGELANSFAHLVLREGAGHMTYRENPLQSAAFVVLKAPDVPSVLYEAGYITSPEDAAHLSSKKGRAEFAEATARAIHIYFARAKSN
jgi:N-acetylmuramoyl-L-alanine amidase